MFLSSCWIWSHRVNISEGLVFFAMEDGIIGGGSLWRAPQGKGKTLLNNSVKAGVDGISLKELYRGLVFAKSGLSWAGCFSERFHLIGGNSCASPGSSQELLDICTKLLEESWSLSFRRSLVFFRVVSFLFWAISKEGSFLSIGFFKKNKTKKTNLFIIPFFIPLAGKQGTMGPGFLWDALFLFVSYEREGPFVHPCPHGAASGSGGGGGRRVGTGTSTSCGVTSRVG